MVEDLTLRVSLLVVFVYKTDSGNFLCLTCVSLYCILTEMFSKVEGASVGVMASGPSGLRREVAAICASKEAENLHFESISFNW